MPEVTVLIGGREFGVACQPGEEPFLQSAAKMLDTEATVILGQIGRMPADRMLLMAGLMLADKTPVWRMISGRFRQDTRHRRKRLPRLRNGWPIARAASPTCRRPARAPNCPTASPTVWPSLPPAPKRWPMNWMRGAADVRCVLART